jgi:hypothetical protein
MFKLLKKLNIKKEKQEGELQRGEAQCSSVKPL